MRNPRSPSYLLIETKLGRPLDEAVSEAREQGESWNRIALSLYTSTEVLVTSETLRGWFGAKVDAA